MVKGPMDQRDGDRGDRGARRKDTAKDAPGNEKGDTQWHRVMTLKCLLINAKVISATLLPNFNRLLLNPPAFGSLTNKMHLLGAFIWKNR